MNFEIIGDIQHVQVIAVGRSIHERKRLTRTYGSGRWRKMKGATTVRMISGKMLRVELHWYEAHGIGRKEYKIKQFIRSL